MFIGSSLISGSVILSELILDFQSFFSSPMEPPGYGLTVGDIELTPATTAVPSRNSSNHYAADKDKEAGVAVSNSPSSYSASSVKDMDKETAVDKGPVAVSEDESSPHIKNLVGDPAVVSDDKNPVLDPDVEANYPKGVKLAIIVLALCLAVFLVALVRLWKTVDIRLVSCLSLE